MNRAVAALRTVLVWLWVWPLVTGVLLGFRHSGVLVPMPLQTLMLTALLVPLISIVLAPAMHRFATKLLRQTFGGDEL